jgi:hypothetical protein
MRNAKISRRLKSKVNQLMHLADYRAYAIMRMLSKTFSHLTAISITKYHVVLVIIPKMSKEKKKTYKLGRLAT